MLLSDASWLNGLGYALLQQEANNTLWLITCGSCSLNDTQNIYATIELECLAIQYDISKCCFYLQGLPNFDIITDHKPLLGIFEKHIFEVENPCLQWLREKNASFQFLGQVGARQTSSYCRRFVTSALFVTPCQWTYSRNIFRSSKWTTSSMQSAAHLSRRTYLPSIHIITYKNTKRLFFQKHGSICFKLQKKWVTGDLFTNSKTSNLCYSTTDKLFPHLVLFHPYLRIFILHTLGLTELWAWLRETR